MDNMAANFLTFSRFFKYLIVGKYFRKISEHIDIDFLTCHIGTQILKPENFAETCRPGLHSNFFTEKSIIFSVFLTKTRWQPNFGQLWGSITQSWLQI